MLPVEVLVPGTNPRTVHTDSGKHHIPESTFNYQKALKENYVQGDVFIARDYFIVQNCLLKIHVCI